MNRILPPALVLGVIAIAIGTAIALRGPSEPSNNPDPNHTHADFAVWVEGRQVDFTDERYMSEAPLEGATAREQAVRHKYLHLHDGIGTVIHRHKPGLPLKEFFMSIGMLMEPQCVMLNNGRKICNTEAEQWTMYVNGQARAFNPDYVFEDTDSILLTYGADETAVGLQLDAMRDDACLYSRTCPERGDPPAENCIADPEVPCVIPD